MIELHVWEKFKEGDKEAFSEIYLDNYNILYNYLNKIGGDAFLTDDCIQDVFLNLWKSRKKLGEVQSVKSYLLASARRDILKKIQKNRRTGLQANEVLLGEPSLLFSEEEIVVGNEVSAEKKKKIIEALNELPKRQREAIYLKYYEELSYDEVANMMNLNYQSVINLTYKAFKVLRGNKFLKNISRVRVVFLLTHFL